MWRCAWPSVSEGTMYNLQDQKCSMSLIAASGDTRTVEQTQSTYIVYTYLHAAQLSCRRGPDQG